MDFSIPPFRFLSVDRFSSSKTVTHAQQEKLLVTFRLDLDRLNRFGRLLEWLVPG